MGERREFVLFGRILFFLLIILSTASSVYASPMLNSVALVPNGNYFIDTFEGYNGNFRIIADFEADENWSYGNAETQNYKEGLQGLRMQLTGSSLQSTAITLQERINMENFDFIDLWVYIQSISDVEYISLSLMTDSSNYSGIKKTGLSSGWNHLHDSKADFLRNADWADVTAINLTVKSKNTVYLVFDDLRAVKSSGHTGIWQEKSGVWGILNITNENGKQTWAYNYQPSAYAYSCINLNSFGISKNSNLTLIYKTKQVLGSTFSWMTGTVFSDGNIYEGSNVQIYGNNLRLMLGSGSPRNATADSNISQTNWNWVKQVINGRNIEIFDSRAKGGDWISRLTYNSSDDSWRKGELLCLEMRDGGGWLVDDIILQGHLKNAAGTEGDGEAYINDTLYAVFLIDGNLTSVAIEWHNASQILLSTITLNPKPDLSNVDNSFPVSLIFMGNTIYAKVTVCDSSSCNSSFTQNVTVVNMPPYLNSFPQIDKSDVYVTDRNITCNLGNVFDLENNEIKSLWRWYKNENPISYAATSELDLTKEKWKKNDNITCSQQVYDSFGNKGIWYNSTSVKIRNSPPRISDLFFEPGTPLLNQEFKVVIGIDDADSDNITSANYTLFDPDGKKVISEKNLTITFTNGSYSIWESPPSKLTQEGRWRYVIRISDNYSSEERADFIYPSKINHPPEIISLSLVKNDGFFIDDFENGKKDLWFNHNSSALKAEIRNDNSTNSNNHVLFLYTYHENGLREAAYCLNKSFSNLSAIVKLKQLYAGDYQWGSIGIRNQDGRAFSNEVQLHIYDKDIRIHDKANTVNDSAADFIEHTNWGWLWFQAYGEEYAGLYSGNGNHWNYTHEITYTDMTAPLYTKGIVCLNVRDSKEENKSWIFDDIFIQEIISENKASVKDNLTAVYLFEDEDMDLLKTAKIEWYKNGILQENLTRETLNPEFDLSNVDNTLPSSYLSGGDEWHAKITICDTSMLCSSALTQKVKIVESKDNVSAEYKKEGNFEQVQQPSITMTGHSILNLKNRLMSQNNLIAIPYLMIFIAIVNFVLKEFKLLKKQAKK